MLETHISRPDEARLMRLWLSSVVIRDKAFVCTLALLLTHDHHQNREGQEEDGRHITHHIPAEHVNTVSYP